MLKYLKIILIALTFTTSALAGSDGELQPSKKSKPAKDCFEPLNRATFAFNQSLDKAILKPIAKSYRKLPAPVKKGTEVPIYRDFNTLSTSVDFPAGTCRSRDAHL